MSSKRVEITDDSLEMIAGGCIQYKYSESRGYGICWINQPDDPAAASQQYKFSDKDAMSSFFDANYGKYGDYMILQKAAEAGLCEVYTG